MDTGMGQQAIIARDAVLFYEVSGYNSGRRRSKLHSEVLGCRLVFLPVEDLTLSEMEEGRKQLTKSLCRHR